MVPDTFRAQTILSVVLGVLVLLLGLLKVTSYTGPGAGPGPFIAMGATLVIVFGVVRPVQRGSWFRTIQSGEPERLAVASGLLKGRAGRFWRFWMHLDADGGNSDRKL